MAERDPLAWPLKVSAMAKRGSLIPAAGALAIAGGDYLLSWSADVVAFKVLVLGYLGVAQAALFAAALLFIAFVVTLGLAAMLGGIALVARWRRSPL